MLSLWLPLWSLIGPDEGFVFLILVFTFFITISIIVKFRSHSAMDAQNRIHYVAQEAMALTKNPFQFRLTPPGKQQDSESNSDAEDGSVNEENGTEPSEDASIDESDGDKRAAGSSKAEAAKVDREKSKPSTSQPTPSTSKQEPTADDDSDFRKGIKIDVFCKENFYLSYFWGVNIDQFHNFMRLNSQSFNDRLLDGSLFDQAYLERNTPKLTTGIGKARTFKLTCSDKVNSETLGQSPRTCYPLVVILARDLAGEENGEKDADDVAFMINVIHVKDKVCPLDTNVITRLLKKRNGLTINLQTLYTPNEFDDETSANTAVCVICQEEMVSIALLPCRHTCTCLECFNKIDKCPLCRSYIRSYFVLKLEENANGETDPNNPTDEAAGTSSNDQQDAPPAAGQPTRPKAGLLRKFKNLFKSQ